MNYTTEQIFFYLFQESEDEFMKKKLLSMGLAVIMAMSTSMNAFASELTPV